MAETSAKRDAGLVDGDPGEPIEELSEPDVDSSTDEASDSSRDEAGEPDAETVLEDELEIVDASPDAPGARQDGAACAPEGPHAGDSGSPSQPFHSVRADEPGPRGCWAMSKRTGQPCSAAKRSDSDYCNAHAGIGIASDPRAYVPKAHAAQQRNREVRTLMRLQLGNTRPTGPRAALQAMAMVESKRLAGRAIKAALSENVPDATAAKLSLAIMREVDPPVQASVEVSADLTPDDVNAMSYSQLLATARAIGVEIPGSPSGGQ